LADKKPGSGHVSPTRLAARPDPVAGRLSPRAVVIAMSVMASSQKGPAPRGRRGDPV
jgi:hypothetical protein